MKRIGLNHLIQEDILVAKAGDLKRGMVVEINGIPHAVKSVDVKSPSSRGASTLYKIRFTNLKTGQKLDESLKGDDFFKDADLVRAKVQFSYIDGDNYIFMNSEDYTQYNLSREDLEDQVGYLTEGLEGIVALLVDDAPMAIELPSSVQLEIVETAPALKGATASGRTKTARLTTGIEIQVPEYLEPGEVVKVNTETGKFMSRA
ncbi:MAG: elongation factor P-like protein YeiP [Methylococcaceae bacterium]|nr:elongation factor P-like protein YeiP [Methylococcaceae bacterium]MDZ4157749.1 elongation factor P-like protein YeiP [Methylococcales bacterium]MDP2392092.1 elongation factor P-like protein YeiP [Methylococcaceae bacterium]MDP3020856.1 elongation factor P-like protein YeiP [Methylococcaceae bacterium]MDP3391674.1 elongation factor P-like protein YeiP [Methylococcaceae bacterium]